MTETVCSYTVVLERSDATAGLLRLVSVLHARSADVRTLSWSIEEDEATAVVSVVPRPGGAAALGQALRRMVHAREVRGPRKAVAMQ